MDTDFLGAIKEEIALEGLDGISVESLWVRLSGRQNFSIKLTDKAKCYLWRCLVRLRDLEYYEIPEPRPPLVIYNSLDSFDPDSGRLIELDEVPEDLYPINIINQDGVCGSCSTYSTRKKVTSRVIADGDQPAMTLEEAKNIWGEKLVIVASQEIRENVICGQLYDPTHKWSSLPNAYCILERIGRSRYNGCMSVGPLSLQIFNMAPKTIFYHTKNLIKLGLVKKQSLTVVDVKHKQQIRRIFHLDRFYKEIKSKYSILLVQVCDHLASCPGHRDEAVNIRELLDLDASLFKKLYNNYSNYLRADKVLFREMYPDATEEEYLCKSGKLEKLIHIITMIQHPQVKKEEDSDEEGDDEEDGANVTGHADRFKTDFNWVYERTTLRQCYDAIRDVGPEGVTQSSLAKLLNVRDNMARVLIKNMIRMKMVDQILKEKGKQKVKYYIAKEHRLHSKLYQEFKEEKEKLFQSEEPLSMEVDSQSSPVAGTSLSVEPPSNSDVTMVTTNNSGVEDTGDLEKADDMKSETNIIRSCESFLAVDEVKEKPKKIPKYRQKKQSMKDRRSDIENMLTSRHLKRMSMILEAVEKDKVLEKTHTFIKMIREREKNEGIDYIIDKKTFDRLAILLVREKKIRIFKALIPGSNNEQQKEVQLLCAKHIQPTDALIKSKLEQLHLRSRCVPKEHLIKAKKKSPAKPQSQQQSKFSDLPESTQENLRKLQEYKMKIKSFDMIYDPSAPKQYGYLPKMPRIRRVHNILWYLCYDYRGRPLPEKPTSDLSGTSSGQEPMETECSDSLASQPGLLKKDLDSIKSEKQGKTDKGKSAEEDKGDVLEQIKTLKEPPLFYDEMSWKRYLPPLPKHKDHPKGWCLISDVLVTLPVCLFCSMVPVNYNLQGLKEILEDPIKSLYPIVYLPYRLTQQLLYARKYIFSFHESCERLAYMGLLSFGTRLLKEKDQVFVYLYQNVCLLDTTRSQEGYCKINMPEGVVCEKRIYNLFNQLQFDHYWTELQEICFASHLNVRKMRNSDIEMREDPPVELSLADSLTPISPEQLVDDPDRCRIPGDHCGAGGMDSSFYTHLYRNWDWSMKNIRKSLSNYSTLRPTGMKSVGVWNDLTKHPAKSSDKYLKVTKPNRLPRILPKERLSLTDTGTGKGPEVVKVTTTETKGNKGGKGVKRKKRMPGISHSKKSKMETPVRAPKLKKKKKIRDDIDVAAEKVRTGQRVSWTAKEDSILLICRIACVILGMSSQKEHSKAPLPHAEVRNILHRYCKEISKDKSTEACKRRIGFILKNPRTEHNMSVFLSEALQDPKIEKEYSHKKVAWGTEETLQDLNDLFELLIKKFSTVDLKQSNLPSHISELPKYTIKMVRKINLNAVTHKDVEDSPADIYIAVLRNIIQTYASLEDKQGRVYECFKLLNQYPRDCIIAATTQLRSNKVITRIKANEHKKQRIPSALQNFKVSQVYWNGYMSRFPDSLFADSAECVHLFEDTFTDPTKYMTFNNITKGGYCACIVAMMSLGIVSFHTQIPRDMIILDPCNIKSWRGYTDPRVNPGKEDKTKKSGASDPNSLVPMETDTTLGATEDAEPSTSTSNKPSTALTPHLLPVEEDYEGAAVKWTSGEVVKVKISNTSCLDLPPQLSMPETQGKPQMTPSRSLITIRRSCASDAENLKHFKFQDNFVISSCNIRMQVKQEEEGTQGKRAVSELMKEVLMSQEEIKRIVHKLTRTLPFELDIDLIWKSVALPLLGPCQQLYNIIDRHGSRGMTRFDLQEMFGGEDWYVTCINLLEEKIAGTLKTLLLKGSEKQRHWIW